MMHSAPLDSASSILGLFAHPDDEVFCLGGAMAKHMAGGGTGRIVSLTRGEGGQIRDASLASRTTLGAVRQTELVRAAAALGVDDTHCCDYADGTLADVAIEPLVDHCRSIIEDFAPDVVISFGPDGAYGHPDHVASAEIVHRAVAASAAQPALLQAVFPQRSNLLVQLIVDWLTNLDQRFLGSEDFAHGLMLFADGSSMLGYAADHLAVQFFPAGTFIIEQGEPPGELFLVLSGTVDVIHEDAAGARQHVACSGAGSFFGEDGLAKGQPRNAHVVAKTSVTCFVLSPSAASNSTGRGARSTATGAPALSRAAEPASVAGNGASSIELDPNCFELDVRAFASHKLAALACHRSQYAIDAALFPTSLSEGIFGREYFRQIAVDSAAISAG